jgi:eukaryotic-like serine/threonine-protein kinase
MMGSRAGEDEPTAITDPSELMPGMLVGEYRIEGPLGRGGMGAVYAATHPVIGKRAAVKVLHAEMSASKQSVERFVQEARAVNQIGHPNIVDIFAFGTLPGGRSYYVMEWLQGETLRQRLDRGRLSLGEALWLIESIATPLEAAHAKGIVHRDLKPDNVFLIEGRDRPVVKLLDFGIAKLLTDASVRTQSGLIVGTPTYLSPEQARGMTVAPSSDVYALGVMAFELVTGKPPFEGQGVHDMLFKHAFETAPSATMLCWVPPGVDALLAQMMAKDAAQRPTLADVRARVREILTNPTSLNAPTIAMPAPVLPERRRMLAVLVASGVAAAGLTLAITMLLRHRANPANDTANTTPQVAPAIAPTAPAIAPSPPPVPDAGIAGSVAGVADAAVEITPEQQATPPDVADVRPGSAKPHRKPRKPRDGHGAGSGSSKPPQQPPDPDAPM